MSVIPPHHDPACWGCGDNPLGLHLPRPVNEGDTEYEAYFSFDERHQGGPAVTARIFVRYRHPVAINTELQIRAWLDEARGRRLHVNGAITDGEEIFAECRAALLHVPLEHFLTTPEGRAAAQRFESTS
jgi:acyl-CoA thioesterase FadM